MLGFILRFILVSAAAAAGYMLIHSISAINIATFAMTVEETKGDNSAYWLFLGGMVASITAAITSIVVAYFQLRLQLAQIVTNRKVDNVEEKVDRTEKKVDVNTELTLATKKAVNGDRDRIVNLEKEKSHSEGFQEGMDSQIANQSGS